MSERTFTISDAVRTQVPLLIGIMSPSGGGKTYSALRLATGIQQVYGGDIYGIDTENNRMKHYADEFKFKHVPFVPPFGSLDYLAAIRHCYGRGARIIIVDSMTHEHIGEGGYLETAEDVVNRIAGDDWKKRESVKMLGWAKAGPLRQKMIEGVKQLDGAFIFCFRAKDKVKPLRSGNRTEVVDMGLMPIAGEEFIYEMAVNLLLPPRSEGVPTWRSDHVGERLMMKLPNHFKGIFEDEKPLDEQIGHALAVWAKGGQAKPQQASPPTPSPAAAAELPEPPPRSTVGTSPLPTVGGSGSDLEVMAREAAEQGTQFFTDWYRRLPPAKQAKLKAEPLYSELKATMEAADKAPPG